MGDYPARRFGLRFWIVTAATLLGVVLTLSLGRWQLSRAAEKEALQAAIDGQGRLPVLSAAELIGAADPQAVLHRRVRLRGLWLNERTVFLDNRQMRGQPGFFVVTPLALEHSGAVVLVQRGWLQRNFVDRTALQPVATPTGIVDVDGLLVPPPSRLYDFAGEERGPIRQNLDLRAFADETGLPLWALSVQQTGDDGSALLREWPAPKTGVEKHYGYAFQWFGLSALLTGLYVWFQFIRRSAPRGRAMSEADQPLGLTVHTMPTPAEAVGSTVQRTRSGRWKMLLVVLVCAAPVVASYFTYYVVRPEGRRVFGELIDPQRPLPDLVARDLQDQPVNLRSLKGQWLMISVADGACDAACESHLYVQRQLRESLGKEKERVDWVWLVTGNTPVRETLRPALQAATVLRVDDAALAQWLAPAAGQALPAHLYMVDPLGNWMMRLPPQLDAAGAAKAKKDIERLLRASSSWDNAGR